MLKAKELLDDIQDLFEMANLWPKETNLPVIVWASQRGHVKHGPRVKVMTHTGKMNIDDTVPISISDNPKILIGDLDIGYFNIVKKWIILNKNILLDYWNEIISTSDLINGLKKV